MADPFTVRETRSDSTITLLPEGELDMATVPALEAALVRAREQARTVVVDLSAVTFIDSTGVSSILRADAESRADGFSLELVPGPPTVQRVFALVGMEHRLPFRRN
jgi:anti-sigma B factor antagonist